MSDDQKQTFSKTQAGRPEKGEERSSLTQRIQYLEQELAENRKKLKELNEASSELSLEEPVLKPSSSSRPKEN